MADRSRAGASRSTLLLTAVAGVAVGAAGLGWWLLSTAERRRREAAIRLRRLTATAASSAGTGLETPLAERQLHDKVHELNRAIDEVRRQLEELGQAQRDTP